MSFFNFQKANQEAVAAEIEEIKRSEAEAASQAERLARVEEMIAGNPLLVRTELGADTSNPRDLMSRAVNAWGGTEGALQHLEQLFGEAHVAPGLHGLDGLVPPAGTLVVTTSITALEALRDTGIPAIALIGGQAGLEAAPFEKLAGCFLWGWPSKNASDESVLKEGLRKALAAGAGAAKMYVPGDDWPEGADASWLLAHEGAEGLTRFCSEGYSTSVVSSTDGSFNLSEWAAGDIFVGEPPQVRYLVDNFIPLGKAGILAAEGDIGKGTTTLQLACAIAFGDQMRLAGKTPMWMGHEVLEHGTVVIISGEDDKDELHRRVSRVDEAGYRFKAKKRLITVAFPNLGGPIPLFAFDRESGKFYRTEEFENLRLQLREIKDLKLVNIDTLSVFAGAIDINSDPQAGAFVAASFAALAQELDATVMSAHHMAKPANKQGITNSNEARYSIRGVSSLVDGHRFAITLWAVSPETTEEVCAELEMEPEDRKVVMLQVVKSNAAVDKRSRTLVRVDGYLEDFTDRLSKKKLTKAQEIELLVRTIREQESVGRPFKEGGRTAHGLDKRTNELPVPLNGYDPKWISNLVKRALLEKKIIKAGMSADEAPCWYGVPGGPLSQGTILEWGNGMGGDFSAA